MSAEGMQKDNRSSSQDESHMSSESGFDDSDDEDQAPPYTWLGRRLNALVRSFSYSSSNQSITNFGYHHDSEGANGGGDDVNKISSGYAMVKSRRNRRGLKIRRKCVVLIAWGLWAFNLTLIIGIHVIFQQVQHGLPKTFAWRKIIHALSIDFLYEVTSECKKAFSMYQVAGYSCSRFQKETFCPIQLQSAWDLYLFTIPCIIFLCPVGMVFLAFKKSRPFLKTLVAFFSSATVYICVFCFAHSVIQYNRGISSLEETMLDEIHDSFAVVTQWWERTQKEGKCCGVHGPDDWEGNFMDPSSTGTIVFPMSCCDPLKSQCKKLPTKNEVYTKGCYEQEQGIIHLYCSVVVVILVLGAIATPLLKFLFYFIARISKKYIGRKTANLRTKNLRCEVYGDVELVAFQLSPEKSEMVFLVADLRADDEITARVNHQRIFKMMIIRKLRVVGRVKIRCMLNPDKNAKGRKAVVYKMATSLSKKVVLINF